jgi:hypothetical protein
MGDSRNGIDSWGVTERYRLSRYIGVALVLLSHYQLLFGLMK